MGGTGLPLATIFRGEMVEDQEQFDPVLSSAAILHEERREVASDDVNGHTHALPRRSQRHAPLSFSLRAPPPLPTCPHPEVREGVKNTWGMLQRVAGPRGHGSVARAFRCAGKVPHRTSLPTERFKLVVRSYDVAKAPRLPNIIHTLLDSVTQRFSEDFISSLVAVHTKLILDDK